MDDETPLQRAYREISDTLMEKCPLLITEDRIFPDMDRVQTLCEEFMRAAGDKFSENYAATQQATDKILGSLHRHFAPIIATQDNTPKDKAILMTWAGNNLADHITWLGVKMSFEVSGVKVVSPEIDSTARSVWVRDTCFILGNTAFLPDPEWDTRTYFRFSEEGNLSIDDSVKTVADARHRDHKTVLKELGLKVFQLKGAYFEGGDLIADTQGQQIFWGGDHYVHSHHSRTLKKAILRTRKEKYDIEYVKTDRRHFHLDIGLSPELPKGHFLVAYNLGKNTGDYRSEGYESLKEYYIPKDRLIGIDFEDSANRFACNLVTVGNTLFMTGCTPDLRKKLEDLGYVVNVPTAEHAKDLQFHWDIASLRRIGSAREGGGVHCMTNEIPANFAP
jgi:N-dimethylarginine dimethylaminohydrolase